ncbi:MAG: hypothetical protein Q7T54_06395 [Candidatus Levybacteria bacterium]|nr:hypothetical protein [Candidatus Levybacteria bacterium]
MNNDARGLLMQSEQARERGDFKKSLELLSDAIVAIVEERKEEKLVDALASQALVYRHLSDKTTSKNYLVLAKHSAMASVELARLGSDTTLLSMAIYNLGKVQESLGDDDDALSSYREAVLLDANRLAMLSEMKTRLSVLEYKKGDTTALERFESSLNDLISAEDKDSYAKCVWLSGAYMHMAEALFETDKNKAKELLDEAGKVIASDMRLKLRKEQLEKLRIKITTNS